MSITLFTRYYRQRRVVLTAASTAFLAEAEGILHQRRAASEATRRVGAQAKTVKLGYYQLLRPDWRAGIVERFWAHFPQVRFHLHEPPTFRAMQEALVAARYAWSARAWCSRNAWKGRCCKRW
ncbi:MAG: hypothetical protein ACRYFK_08275 [Janthinobacterium lividum]